MQSSHSFPCISGKNCKKYIINIKLIKIRACSGIPCQPSVLATILLHHHTSKMVRGPAGLCNEDKQVSSCGVGLGEMINGVQKYITLIKFFSPSHNFSYQTCSHPFRQLAAMCSKKKNFCFKFQNYALLLFCQCKM